MSTVLSFRGRASLLATAVVTSVLCGSLMSASATIDSGDRSVYVPITPCRVMDTRPAPDNVGSRSTPLVAQETHTISVLGTNGNCTIPADASAVAMNVTVVNVDDQSYLTVFPADAPRPLASSVNWVAGQGPTPNAVTSDVSADGKISFFNNAGRADVVADIVGYFVNHNHDDRYYTKAEIDTKVARTVPGTLVLGVAEFNPYTNPAPAYLINVTAGTISGVAANICFNAPVPLPNGATVTAMHSYGNDAVAGTFSQSMLADPIGPGSPTLMANASSTGTPGDVPLDDTSVNIPTVDTLNFSYAVRVCMDAGIVFYGAQIDYTIPS